MRKIFLDCGAHNGCSVRHFKKMDEYSDDFEIFSFEANSNLFEELQREGEWCENIAVWVKDGTMEFFQTGKTGASSLNKKKSEWNVNPNRTGKIHNDQKSVIVKTMDFDFFIKDSFNKDDYIILKLDIEGSEYEVLDHMLDNGSMSWIDKLYIEFHNYKCGVSISEDIRLTTEIENMGIPVKMWDALSS